MRLPRPSLARPGIALALAAILGAVIFSACATDQSGLSVGDVAPTFRLPSVSSGEVDLSDYQGQPVLLFFHMAVG